MISNIPCGRCNSSEASSRRWSRTGVLLILGSLGVIAVGCTPDLETRYGHVSGESVNGTGVFARLLQSRGHQVRSSWRLNDEVGSWADVIVRFATAPGVIDAEEAAWYQFWLEGESNRLLIYVCRDVELEHEYWTEVLENIPRDADPDLIQSIERKQRETANWAASLPTPSDDPADRMTWFGTEGGTRTKTCATLGGPWAFGVDPTAAALPRRQSLRVNFGNQADYVLLRGDGEPLVLNWILEEDADDYTLDESEYSEILIIANGAFLLNAGMVNPERRLIATHLLDTIRDPSRKIAFVEGEAILINLPQAPDLWERIQRLPMLSLVEAHFLVIAIIAVLARAVTFGRPKPGPSSAADRPAAHASALGYLLSRTRETEAARIILSGYQRWRRPPTRHEFDPGTKDRPEGSSQKTTLKDRGPDLTYLDDRAEDRSERTDT